MDTNSQYIITPEGLETLKDELHLRINVTRVEIADQIEEATKQGDLSENAMYQAALEAKDRNEARIKELGDMIMNAQVVVSNGRNTKVEIGESVTVKDLATKKKLTYTIVGENEADVFAGKIAVNTPVAQALVGKRVGDKVNINTPSGERILEIISIG